MAYIRCGGKGSGGTDIDTELVELKLHSVTAHPDGAHSAGLRLSRINCNQNVEVVGSGGYKCDFDAYYSDMTAISSRVNIPQFTDFFSLQANGGGASVSTGTFEFEVGNFNDFLIYSNSAHADGNVRVGIEIPKEILDNYSKIICSNKKNTFTPFYLVDEVFSSSSSTVNSITVDTEMAIPAVTDYLLIGFNSREGYLRIQLVE